MTKFKFPFEYTKILQNALASWKIEDWSLDDKKKRIKSEKYILKRLAKLSRRLHERGDYRRTSVSLPFCSSES